MLTDRAVKLAEAQPKAYKLNDGQGLYLYVSTTGSKYWRLKYRFLGRESTASFGEYPIVTLREAREKLIEFKKKLTLGVDPNKIKSAVRDFYHVSLENDTFEQLARLWWSEKVDGHLNRSHGIRSLRRLELYAFPLIGKIKVAELKVTHITALLDKCKTKAGLDTANRVLGLISRVLRYCAQKGVIENDISHNLKSYLPKARPRHFSALLTPEQLQQYFERVGKFKGQKTTEIALKVLPFLFCRVGELRNMKWSQLNFELKEWRFQASKTQTDHLVPLSDRVISLLKELEHLKNRSHFVFASSVDKTIPISDNTINKALRSLGYCTRTEVTGHGFRATARTLLHERLGFSPEVVEHQLAHSVPDSLGRAYNRTRFIEQRIKLMNKWSDFLVNLGG